jgi:putative hydrolase of the HAD superfamily
MILIFDLDDTLYEERLFVESGFRAVADFGRDHFGLNCIESFDFMIRTLEQEGRGAIFDKWLITNGRYKKKRVYDCIRVYRCHSPNIHINEHAQRILPLISHKSLYLVTDGHKLVQDIKIKSLGIDHFFKRIFITHRYGIKYEKPSLYCFECIRRRERCSWEEMMYIGDNPAKDFVNLNKVGVHTVRVHTGHYKKKTAKPGYDAVHSIADLGELPNLLKELE